VSRKQFIESVGATCSNWTWSWSFVDRRKRVVIFGEWDTNKERNRSLILDTKWETSRRGRRQPGYKQALQHIRLVEQNGYQLMTFPMIHSDENEGEGDGPAKIKSFGRQLTPRSVVRVGSRWFATEPLTARLPEELPDDMVFIEGASHGGSYQGPATRVPKLPCDDSQKRPKGYSPSR